MSRSIFRPIQLVLLGALGLVVVAISISAWLTWEERQRLDRAHGLLRETLAFHEQHRRVERELLDIALGRAGSTPGQLARQLDELIAMCPKDDVRTRSKLAAVREQIAQLELASAPPLMHSIASLHEIALDEAREEAELIADLRDDAEWHMRYELAAPIALLALGVVTIPITRRRVVRPLEEFGRQMTGLAEGDFTPTPEERLSSSTLPLHRSFIRLAMRLQELEREHREREASLEREVRTATEALLEQQQSLARAERLAVAGELAASVAHEVRNPLAGIQMSLTNLRHELPDAELRDRVDRVIAEVERLARLVGEIVDAARHDPEPASTFPVPELVDELLHLVRYQLPAGVELESRIESSLRARAPKERLRQALLNLVLNAANAIGPQGGRIEIEIAARGEDLQVCVRDDGPGFPEELIETGVRPFYSTRARGTGLGLAMVRRFVRDADGTMELSNLEGEGRHRGARVTLLLPSAVEHG